LDIEIRQLGDILRNLDLQVPPATTLASNDTGFGAPDQRAVVFPVGFTARDLDQTQEPQLAAFFGTPKGVLVLSVAKGTSAERTGIKAGDVIVGTYNRGGLNDRFANTEFKRATPAGYPSNELATADLLAGVVEAQVQDSTAAVYLSRQNPKLAAMAPENVFHPVFVAILMRREDQALQSYVNIWIDQIEMDGTLAKIRTKWLGS